MKENDNKNILTITYEPIPNEKNIDNTFQRLVLILVSTTGFKTHKELHQAFKQILNTVMK